MPFEGPGELLREVRAPIPGDWDEYLADVVRWLERHWRDQRCPRCREDRWRIQPVVGLVVAAEPWPRPQQQRGQDAALASIPVTCTTCGRVELVNAFYVFRLPPWFMRLTKELREHLRLFRQETRLVIGAEGLLGVVALVAFIKSLVEPPTHVVVVHGRLVEQQSSIHPSWGWLCIVLGIALFAEARAVHRLLRAHGREPELIRLTPTPRASSTCGRAPLPRDPYAETAPYPQIPPAVSPDVRHLYPRLTSRR